MATVARESRLQVMTEPFCFSCAEDLLGAAAIETARRNVANAPPASPELRAQVRSVFQSARDSRPTILQRRACGHGELGES
jgi:hypothetical protein